MIIDTEMLFQDEIQQIIFWLWLFSLPTQLTTIPFTTLLQVEFHLGKIVKDYNVKYFSYILLDVKIKFILGIAKSILKHSEST